MKYGGVANRWQVGPKAYPKEDQFLDLKALKKSSLDEIDQLSPAEKFDILRGDYDYSMTRQELEERGPLRDPRPRIWEGFCNGVRCASTNLPEPRSPIVLKNSDGIQIRFQPADLKALAGVSFFYVEKYAQLGSPTQDLRAENQPNAAVFDLALRFYLSKKKKSFVIDSSLGPEIWNESVIGYKRSISNPEEISASERRKFPWAVSKVLVKGVLETLGEVNINETNGPTQEKVAAGELNSTIRFSYTLYLDEDGRARDGEWIQGRGLRGIDFAWFGLGRGADADYAENGTGNKFLDFDLLKRMINKSAAPSCRALFR